MLIPLLAAITMLPPGTLSAAPERLWVRNASVDLTPPEALPLGGYTARQGKLAEPGGDPLYARAVVFGTGEDRITLVSLEMLTVPESLVREVKTRLPDRKNLFLSATHTHSAPDSQMLNDRMTFAIPGIATYKQRWLEWYADKIAESVLAAEEAEPLMLTHAAASNRSLGLNRGRRTGAEPNDLATAILGLLNGWHPIWLTYAAHATVYDEQRLKASGDWPGVAAEVFRAPVLVGAIGDVSPAAEGATPEQKLEVFRSRISEIYSNPTHWTTVWRQGDPLRFISQPIPLDAVKHHPEFASGNRIPDVLAQSLVEKFAPKEAEVTAFRIGKLAVVGIPGEPTSHIGRAIRDYGLNRGFLNVLVISHVNGWIGYILQPEDYDRGGYEATLSFYGREQGAKVEAAAKQAIDRLRVTGTKEMRL